MNNRMTKTWMGTSAVLLGGLAGSANAAAVPNSEHVAKLLSEAKTMAFQLKEDAVAMEGYTRMNVSWESHAVAINQIKDHVNGLVKQEAKLKGREERRLALAENRDRSDRALPGRVGRIHLRRHRTHYRST